MEIYRGVVRAYDAGNHRADVLLVGSMSRVVLALPVAHQVGPELVVEGAACVVLFFGDSASGVVVCTFDGAPAPWVTPALLTFSPATPGYQLQTTSTAQTLTTTATTYQGLAATVTVPSGKTYDVVVMANVEFECTSYTNYNVDAVQVHRWSNSVGQPQGRRHNAVNERGSCTVCFADKITSTKEYSAKVWKSLDRNTEVARRGSLAVLYWEATV